MAMMDKIPAVYLLHQVAVPWNPAMPLVPLPDDRQGSGSDGSYESGYKSDQRDENGHNIGARFNPSGFRNVYHAININNDEFKEKERARDRERRLDRDRRKDPSERDRSKDRFDNIESVQNIASYGLENKSVGFSSLSGSGSSSLSGAGSGSSSPYTVLTMDRAGEKWMTDTPTNTVLLRGLPPQIDEKDIRAELMIFGVPIKEVRLMKNKATGTSRGFAFVEFQSVEDAQRWMELNQGKLVMQNQYPVSMYYSTPRGGEHGNQARDHNQKTDWMCSKCGAHNFRRRDFCFKCSISREESERTSSEDGMDQVGSNPCNTLILRGLDALTSEDSIIAALNTITALPIKNVCVIKDELTSTSKGYAFLEMNSLRESSQLLEMLAHRSTPLEVDGKAILVSYAKNTYTTVMTTLSNQPTVQWSEATGYDYSQYYQGGDYYDQTTGTYYNYDQSYYGQQGYDFYKQTATTTQSQQQTSQTPPLQSPTTLSDKKKKTQTDSTNAAAAVAQAAIQQAQAAKQFQKHQEEMHKHLITHMHQQQKLAEMSQEERLAHEAQAWSQHSEDETDSTQYTTYPVPDVSTYQYDETSGYYYDPLTGLYYDSNTQYYYNSETGHFLYWDSEKSTYLPAPTEGDEAGREDGSRPKKDTKDKKEKVKMAKKIAKDMEKWAKSLNAQKEAMKDVRKTSQPPTSISAPAPMTAVVPADFVKKETGAADAGWAMLEKKPVEEKKLMPPPSFTGQSDTPKSQQSKGALVASYGGDSDSEEEDESSQSTGEKFTDMKKLACLLCKRQFPSKEALVRHTQLSDLHKKNLEAAKVRIAASNPGDGRQYRDRAQERRQKFGIPAPPEPKKKSQYKEMAETFYEEPNKQGIQEGNIGNKMLKKMGWSAGQGLGKKGQGIVAPIEAQKRQMTAGLGMRGSSYNVSATDSYKDAVKKTMFARYHEAAE